MSAFEVLVPELQQSPCDWCRGGYVLACTCRSLCTEARCPFHEEKRDTLQPLPQFAEMLGLALRANRPAGLPGPARMPVARDADAAISRVLALHAPCPCSRCQAPAEKPSCRGCQDWWPCPTARAVSGTPQLFVEV